MNIFLPYEKDIVEDVKALDDVRLNKQISECKTMLKAILTHMESGEKLGYFYHPVTQFYYNNPYFIAVYGLFCCSEYYYRNEKRHECRGYFEEYLNNNSGVKIWDFVPYYMEGAITDPNHIRTTENVGELFIIKMCKKWVADTKKNRTPKWTKRSVPEFYKRYLEENNYAI